jgi:membrane protein
MIWTNPKALWSLVKESATAWNDDYAPSMGAALAYYTVFSIAPLLIIIIAVAGLVLGQDAAQGRIFGELRGLIGDQGASAIEGMVQSASQPAKSIVATIAGIVTLVLGATTVFGELQSDLDRVWKAPAPPKASGIWKLLRTRLLSFGMVLGLGFLLLVSLVVSAALSGLAKLYGGFFGDYEWLLQIVNFIVSFAVITTLFAMIYKWLPRTPIAWHDVWIGAAVTALLFSIGKFAIGLYLGKSSVVSGFGAAGSLVVLLVWVYYSAQIFLLGAEFTWAYAHRYGSRRAQAKQAAPTHASSAERQREPQVAVDRMPVPSNDEIVEVLTVEEDAATRAARSADRHPALSMAVAAAGFAAVGFAFQWMKRRAAAH